MQIIQPSTRRLHLVDIENLIGSPRPTASEAIYCHQQYEDRLAVAKHDLVVVACNHGAALAVGSGWRGARLILRSGQDGADLALLHVIDHENIQNRFTSVVVASGDGCFADPVAWLGRRGVDVTPSPTGALFPGGCGSAPSMSSSSTPSLCPPIRLSPH